MSQSGGGFLMEPARFPGRAPIEAYGNGGFRFAGHVASRLDPGAAERNRGVARRRC